MHLFRNRYAIRAAGLGGGGGGTTGQNPPNGAVLDFYFDEVPEAQVRLEVTTVTGGLVRAYSTDPDTDVGEEELDVEAGMNRLVWDLRYPGVFRVPELYTFSSTQGRRVMPGAYTVRLTAGDEEQTATVQVRGDPRLDTTPAQYRAQEELVRQIAAETEALHRAVYRIGEVRDQVEAILERIRVDAEADPEAPTADAGGAAGAGALTSAQDPTDRVLELGTALVDSLTMVEDSLVQWETYDGQTVLNASSRINFQYLYLMQNVEGADDGVTEGAREVFQDLNARWHPLRDRLDTLLEEGVAILNTAIREAGIQPVGIGGSGAGG